MPAQLIPWIPLFSAFVALASLTVAIVSLITARRAYSAALASCSVYLIDSFRHRPESHNSSVFVVSLEVRNESTVANAIAQVECHIVLRRDADRMSLVCLHNPDSVLVPALKLSRLMSLPMSIAPRGVVQGTACFDLPAAVVEGAVLEHVVVELRFAGGANARTDPILVADLPDVSQLDARKEVGVVF